MIAKAEERPAFPALAQEPLRIWRELREQCGVSDMGAVSPIRPADLVAHMRATNVADDVFESVYRMVLMIDSAYREARAGTSKNGRNPGVHPA